MVAVLVVVAELGWEQRGALGIPVPSLQLVLVGLAAQQMFGQVAEVDLVLRLVEQETFAEVVVEHH